MRSSTREIRTTISAVRMLLRAVSGYVVGRRGHRAASILMLWTGFLSGCVALLGAAFNATFCDQAGACGVRGQIVRSHALGVTEVSPRFGEGPLLSFLDVTGGVVFAETSRGLRLYVAVADGLREYTGFVARDLDLNPPRVTPVPDCVLGDVVVLDDGHIIASCRGSPRLVRIDPEATAVVDSFSCCEEAGTSFDPFALALAPDGAVLAGTTRIHRFDTSSGELLGVAVEEGLLGAEDYVDYEFGPDGNLFVSANPNIGVLEFDGSTFELARVLVPGGIEAMPLLGPITFHPEGFLLVSSLETTEDGAPLVELDLASNGAIRERAEVVEPGCCTAGDRIFSMAVRPLAEP